MFCFRSRFSGKVRGDEERERESTRTSTYAAMWGREGEDLVMRSVH